LPLCRCISQCAPPSAQSARDYFALAEAFLKPAVPRLVAVGGLSGTGKSLLARELASLLDPAPGAVWLRSDVERKALLGGGETERLPESAYGAEVTTRVYAALAAKARRIVAAGHSAVADAVFADAAERAAIEEAAPGAFKGLFLTAPLAARLARVGARMDDASDADAAVARRQEQYNIGPMHWVAVDASGSPGDTLRRAKDALELN